MAKPRAQLARRLAAHRKAEGVSALALAKAAHLSMNVVRNIERGLRLPRIATIRRLARELHLGASDLDELVRLAALARMPAQAREALSGPPVAGIVVWKHLPELLFTEVEHAEPELGLQDPDAVLVDVVRGAASVLCWIGTRSAPLTESQASELRAAAASHFSRSLELGKSIPIPEHGWGPEEAAVATLRALPSIRRGQLFNSLRWVRSAARSLAFWDHYGGVPAAAPFEAPSLSFAFRSRDLAGLSFKFVPVDLVVNTHDAMTAWRIWHDLKLAKDLAPASPDCWTDSIDLRRSVDFIIEHHLSDFTRKPPRTGSACQVRRDLAALSRWQSGLEHECRAEFALRLYELPDLAQALLGQPREAVCRRCQQIRDFRAEISAS